MWVASVPPWFFHAVIAKLTKWKRTESKGPLSLQDYHCYIDTPGIFRCEHLNGICEPEQGGAGMSTPHLLLMLETLHLLLKLETLHLPLKLETLHMSLKLETFHLSLKLETFHLSL